MDLVHSVVLDVNRYLPLVLPLVVAAAARPLSEWLPPRPATWLLTGLTLLVTVMSTLTLAVLAAEGVLAIPAVAALGHLSMPIIRRDSAASVSPAVGIFAAVLLLAGLAALLRAVWRQARAFRAAAASVRDLPGEGRVAVLDDDLPEAFAVPGRPGRVVVSSGMLGVLDDAEQTALLAHEYAHLDCRHHLFRTVVQVASAANPLLRPVRGAIRYATERWADERSAAATGDRKVAARAIGKAALAARHMRLSTTLLMVGGPGPVPRRVRALLVPRERHWTRTAGLLAASMVAMLVLVSLESAQDDAAGLHTMVERAQLSTAYQGRQ